MMSIWAWLFGPRQTPDSQIRQFIDGIAEGGPAECQLSINQYPHFRETLYERLKAEGLGDSKIVHMVKDSLVGVCPQCGARMNGEYLDWLWVTGNPDLSVVFVSGGGRPERFSQGKCVIEWCSSRHVTLHWQPRQSGG